MQLQIGMPTAALLSMCTLAGCGEDPEIVKGRQALVEDLRATLQEVQETADGYDFDSARAIVLDLRQKVDDSPFANVETYNALNSEIDKVEGAVWDQEKSYRAKLQKGWSHFEGRFISAEEKARILTERKRKEEKQQRREAEEREARRKAMEEEARRRAMAEEARRKLREEEARRRPNQEQARREPERKRASQEQRQRERAEREKRRLIKKANLVTTYDKFNDTTTVKLPESDLPVVNTKSGAHTFLVLTVHKGRRPAPTEDYLMGISSLSREWVYIDRHRELELVILVDEQKIALPALYYKSDIITGYGLNMLCYETIGFCLGPKQMRQLATAKKIEAKLGPNEFVLSHDQRDAIAGLYYYVNP